MKRRHSFEERLNVVSLVLSGEAIQSVSRSFSIDKNQVKQWYLRYKKYGEEGLRHKSPFCHSADEKAKIIKELLLSDKLD